MNTKLLSVLVGALMGAGLSILSAGAAVAGHTETCADNPIDYPLLEEPAELKEDGPVSSPFHNGVATIHLTQDRIGPEDLLRRDLGISHELNCNVIVVLEDNLVPADLQERTVDVENRLFDRVDGLQRRVMELV